MKTIAVDIDDTLNDFTETLRTATFGEPGSYALKREAYDKYLRMIRSGEGEEDDLLSTEFTYFRYKIHCECYERARVADGARDFMQWLKETGWRVVVCTTRDLRRSNEATRRWLGEQGMPFDYLFLALNKLEFCNAWDIDCLVDDHLFTVTNADRYGVKVYYPIMPKHANVESRCARGYGSFEELRQWIQK